MEKSDTPDSNLYISPRGRWLKVMYSGVNDLYIYYTCTTVHPLRLNGNEKGSSVFLYSTWNYVQKYHQVSLLSEFIVVFTFFQKLTDEAVHFLNLFS